MVKPKVVLTPIASVDGRITPYADQILLDPETRRHWTDLWAPDTRAILEQRSDYLRRTYDARATLEGSGSFSSRPATPAPRRSGNPRELPSEWLPREADRWLAVVDSRGRVGWERPSNGDTALLVLISRNTPRDYVADLYDRGFSYIAVGDNQIDLEVAVERLARLSDRSTILSSAGGTLNAALLRSGLVTDLHLVTIPALIGGARTPSFLDSPERQSDGTHVTLELVELVQGKHGTTWSHYSVAAR